MGHFVLREYLFVSDMQAGPGKIFRAEEMKIIHLPV